MHSLARGAGRRFQGGQVRQTIIEMDGALLFISAADEGMCLAVLADTEADAGLIAYEMAMLIKRVGFHLVAKPRPPEQNHVCWVNHGHEVRRRLDGLGRRPGGQAVHRDGRADTAQG